MASGQRIAVRVHPRASRERQVWNGERLELWVREPPVDGAANDAVRRAVAQWLALAVSQVILVSGHSSRSKVVEVPGALAMPQPDTLF